MQLILGLVTGTLTGKGPLRGEGDIPQVGGGGGGGEEKCLSGPAKGIVEA